MDKKRNHLYLIIIGIVICLSTNTFSQSDEFEFIPKSPNKEQAENSNKNLLFDLLDSASNKQTESPQNNQWGNNPFMQQQAAIQKPVQETVEKKDTLDVFEYQIHAIWKINDQYKALISGHIIGENESINSIKVTKITNKEITVEKNKSKKTFRLGSKFYDFEI